MTTPLDGWLHRLESLHPKSIELGLQRCGEVWRRLGSPRPARQVLTVAGTNGKGSVVATLHALLSALGDRCGSYTSPHILEFNERIRLQDRLAEDAEIVEALQAVDRARGDISLTYFEFTTLAALLIMQAAQLDSAVLEVGLGGRLDAVNVVDPDCAIITAIGLDHQDYLGPDRDSIGREKAGIMRPGRPVIIGDRDPPASLLAHAEAIGAKPLLAGCDFGIARTDTGVCFRFDKRTWSLPAPVLAGAHQLDNLAAALAALAILRPGFLDQIEAVERGVLSVQITGRLQAWPGDDRIVLDVGHNPQAAGAVAAWLARYRPGRCLCVLGMLADKDAEQAGALLASAVDLFCCAELAGARGQSDTQLAARLSSTVPDRTVQACGSVAQALDFALASAADGDTVLVFGSFLTVAEAMQHLRQSRHREGHC